MQPIGLAIGTHYNMSSWCMEDIESSIYSPLTATTSLPAAAARRRRPMKIFISALLLTLGVAMASDPMEKQPLRSHIFSLLKLPQFQPELSEKQNLGVSFDNSMLQWQRTECHFQPEGNWLGGPNGPLYFGGMYHLFYQYNPNGTTLAGNISWGHAISTDMIHWRYLPLALTPDQPFDMNGVWSGSATKLSSGQIVMLYTGLDNDSIPVQNVAFPANMSDPFLLNWVKYSDNPILDPLSTDNETTAFHGPSTAWMRSDGVWYFTVGSTQEADGETVGAAALYSTTNFETYSQQDMPLHEVDGQSSWDVMDFYPVAVEGQVGVDTSSVAPNLKHVLKASISSTQEDFYAIGVYDPVTLKWTPDNPEADVGLGLKYDYGTYYASKTFFDATKQKRILFGVINETDSAATDEQKGWSGVHAIPRTVLMDTKTTNSLVLWPIGEVEGLRKSYKSIHRKIGPGSVVSLNMDATNPLDIVAEFEVNTSGRTVEDFNCSSGAAERGKMGPFGLLVLTDQSSYELTPIYFRPFSTSAGNLTTCFCTDTTRSSLGDGVTKVVYGTTVPVFKHEQHTLRVIVDHSVVESFAQHGRRVISSRVYPTKAINGNSGLYLFNNATGVTVTANIRVYELSSASIGPYPFRKDYVSDI